MNFRKKQSNSPILGNNPVDIVIFKDPSFRFLYQKTERLSLAIYLITNLMSVNEPIKWDLRKVSLELLDAVMSLSNVNLSLKDSNLREINKKLFHLISLYKVAYRSGFISQMNYQIVDSELQKLANFLLDYDKKDSDSKNQLFNDDFFNKGIEEVNLEQEQERGDIFVKDSLFEGQYKTTSGVNKTNTIKDNIYTKGHNKGQYKRQDNKMSFNDTSAPNNVSNKSTGGNTNKSSSRNARRDKIINIIKQKGRVSIKDISNIIKDTSEKTIQRELISMVNEGVLLKEGERRWSQYSMIKQ